MISIESDMNKILLVVSAAAAVTQTQCRRNTETQRPQSWEKLI